MRGISRCRRQDRVESAASRFGIGSRNLDHLQRVNAQDAVSAAPVPDTQVSFELPNGDMTQGNDLPTGWQRTGNRAVKATSDTVVFRSAPASLCVTDTNPSPLNFGTARLLIHNSDVKSFTLSGFVGSEAGVTRSLSIEYKSEDGAGFIGDSIDLPPHQDQWLSFSKKLTLPPYVTQFTLIYAITGEEALGSMTSK